MGRPKHVRTNGNRLRQSVRGDRGRQSLSVLDYAERRVHAGRPIYTSPYNLPTPTERNSWNLSVQRQFGATWIVSEHLHRRNLAISISQSISRSTMRNCRNIQPMASLCRRLPLRAVPQQYASPPCPQLLNPRRTIRREYGSMGARGHANLQRPADFCSEAVQPRHQRQRQLDVVHCIGVFQGYDSKSDETSTST